MVLILILDYVRLSKGYNGPARLEPPERAKHRKNLIFEEEKNKWKGFSGQKI